MLVGCGATPATIKVVQDKQVEPFKASADSKPIEFSRIVVKLKRGQHIGALQGGLFCMSEAELFWKGGRMSVDSDDFTDAFKEGLEKYSFKAVGDKSTVFEDKSTWKSEILVAGMVRDLQANICYPNRGRASSKGEAYIKVDWEIYSKLDKAVVHTVRTEGAGRTESAVPAGNTTAVLNAFAQATRNLLADEKFREIVGKGGKTVRETSFKSGGAIVITRVSSKPLKDKPKEWHLAVVTIFAGDVLGSGFAISDDLILTNHHVAGEANMVTVKFYNGVRVLGKVMASNSARDVALIKVDATLARHFRVLRADPPIGSEVYAIGTPLDEDLESTVSRGIVSGYRERDKKKFIQSDVNVQHGNSGGPLVDKSGAVVGITAEGLDKDGVARGINFFIPIDEALKALNII